MIHMANTEDKTLPNWRKTEKQCNDEGWFMVNGDPTHWKNRDTKEEIFGKDHKKKGGK